MDAWSPTQSAVAITFDSPHRHSRIERQIDAALKLKARYPQFVHELLIKPEKKGEFINLESVERVITQLRDFPVIGLTEQELDTKLIAKMEKIAVIRRLLDKNNIKSPIHIFGSLDTFVTPLFFLAGAEIFDGLTWLRFGYFEGQTVYRQNYGAMCGANGILKSAQELSHAMWKDNYYYLESLRDQMRNFARSGKYEHFGKIGGQLQHAVQQMESRLPT